MVTEELRLVLREPANTHLNKGQTCNENVPMDPLEGVRGFCPWSLVALPAADQNTPQNAVCVRTTNILRNSTAGELEVYNGEGEVAKIATLYMHGNPLGDSSQ